MKQKTCFFTGHRIVPKAEEARIRENTYALCVSLIENMQIQRFCCGGALGFDTLAAQTVLLLKEKYPMVQLHMILPCKGQESKWTKKDKQIYKAIIEAADSVEYVSENYTTYCMHARNRHMVNLSCCGIAFLRSSVGGTAYTVQYAREKDVKMFSVDRVPKKDA